MFARGFVGGEGVRGEGGCRFDRKTLERVRDAMMVKLRRRGVPIKSIAVIIGLHHSNVSRRLAAIPDDVRTWYENIEVL